LNVGYSYGSDGASNTNAAAKDVYAFLQLFFQEFPEYAELDFHVAGESCMSIVLDVCALCIGGT
jgi:cathepsin A (carboxypeptidase C)